MKQISAPVMTAALRRLLPILWVGGVIMFGAIFVLIGVLQGEWIVLITAVPICMLMAWLGVIGAKYVCFNLADEVWDAGDYLIVRQTGQEHRIALQDIRRVDCQPQCVILQLRDACPLGKSIHFVPPTTILAVPQEILDLRARIKAGKSKQGSEDQ
jgi:hypothetical protein